jgi:hypothetical protein
MRTQRDTCCLTLQTGSSLPESLGVPLVSNCTMVPQGDGRQGAAGGFIQTPIHDTRAGVAAAPSRAPTEAGQSFCSMGAIEVSLRTVYQCNQSRALPLHIPSPCAISALPWEGVSPNSRGEGQHHFLYFELQCQIWRSSTGQNWRSSTAKFERRNSLSGNDSVHIPKSWGLDGLGQGARAAAVTRPQQRPHLIG